MRKHSVKHDFNAFFFRFRNQPCKIFKTAEVGVGKSVVCGVVLVVGIRLEHGIEIDNRDSERFKVIEFLLDSEKITAEHIAVFNYSFFIRLKSRHTAPVVAVDHVGLGFFAFAADSESVGKNLIDYSAVQPFGAFVSLFICRNSPSFSFVAREKVFPCEKAVTVGNKAIAVQSDRGYIERDRKTIALLLHRIGDVVFVFAFFFKHQRNRIRFGRERNGERERYFHRSRHAFVFFI